MPTQSLGKCPNLIAIIFRKPSGKTLLPETVFPIRLDFDIIRYLEE